MPNKYAHFNHDGTLLATYTAEELSSNGSSVILLSKNNRGDLLTMTGVVNLLPGQSFIKDEGEVARKERKKR